jgi:group I intron endonuclease
MKCGIYGIRNIVNGKWYIGQSVNIHKRKCLHFSFLNRGVHFSKHLQSAYSKYGASSFEFHILEEAPIHMLDIYECAWIDFYKSDKDLFGYNLRSGGQINHRYSQDSKNKMSESHKGKILSEEHKRHILESRKGYRHSAETRRKIGESHKGLKLPPHSEEWKIKMSAMMKGAKNHNFGKRFSEKICLKFSLSHRGQIVSQETKRKLSDALKGKPWTDARRKSQINKQHKEESV